MVITSLKLFKVKGVSKLLESCMNIMTLAFMYSTQGWYSRVVRSLEVEKGGVDEERYHVYTAK